jgi:SAM-dependent methyltransferase
VERRLLAASEGFYAVAMNRNRRLTGRDWSVRYAFGSPPWDLGGPHPELVARLAEDPLLGLERSGRRALVPGSGLGHDAEALSRAGWAVTAVDIASELEPLVRGRFGPLGCRFVAEDALTFNDEEPYDLLFDHTFFCAIDPEDRPAFGELARRLLRPGGRVVSVVFPAGKDLASGGPPWGMSTAELAIALGPEFHQVEDQTVVLCGHPSWNERWALFARV